MSSELPDAFFLKKYIFTYTGYMKIFGLHKELLWLPVTGLQRTWSQTETQAITPVFGHFGLQRYIKINCSNMV